MKPSVSILIPVYNREHLIGETIQSALSQTFQDHEVIVVDNASTDGTWDVCRSFRNKDPRIKIFRNEQNLGPVRNWQRCGQLAGGTFCKLLFSDDAILPDFLARTLPLLEDEQVGFVFTQTFMGRSMADGKEAFRFLRSTGNHPTKKFIVESLSGGDAPFSPGCALFRTEDLRKNLLLTIPSPTITDFADHGAGPDLLLYLKTAWQYPKVGYVAEPLSFFRAHHGSISESAVRPYLLSCYRQAKICFAEQHFGSYAVKFLLAREWRRERKESGERIGIEEFKARYSLRNYHLGPLVMLYPLVGRMARKKLLSFAM